MLVKLGEVWVDPTKVVSLHGTFVTTTENCIDVHGNIDEFAAIINNSIGQTYGGEEDVTKKD